MSKKKDRNVKVEEPVKEVIVEELEPEDEEDFFEEAEEVDEPLIKVNKAKLFAGLKKAGKVLALIGAGATAATVAIVAIARSQNDQEEEEPLMIEEKNEEEPVDSESDEEPADSETYTEPSPDVVVQDF